MAVTPLNVLPYGVLTPVSIALTTASITNYGTFSIAGAPNGRDHTLTLGATGVGALPTTLTVDLEASSDGGTTWGKYSTGIALVATAALTFKVLVNVVSGLLYRINPTTVTLGSATSTTVVGCVN